MKEEKKDLLEKYKTIFVEEFEGPSVEEAIKVALNSLKMSTDEIKIKVLFEGEPGLFGLEGSKPARIKVFPNLDKIENLIKYFTIKLLDFVKEKISFVDVKIQDDVVEIKIIFDEKDILDKIKFLGVDNALYTLIECFVNKILSTDYKIDIKFD